MNERVGRVEVLLDGVLKKIGGVEDEERRNAAEALEDLANHAPTPSSMTPTAHESAPVLSLFDNTVVCYALLYKILAHLIEVWSPR